MSKLKSFDKAQDRVQMKSKVQMTYSLSPGGEDKGEGEIF
jgi:hypothetical protein